MNTVENAAAGVREFFGTGATRNLDFRKNALKRLLRNISLMENEICDALYEDLGKSRTEAYMTEVGMTKESIRYMLRNMRRLAKPVRAGLSPAQMPGKARIFPEPHGCVLIISPWNYPFLLALDPLAAAVAAGNCCILKPSEYAPATCRILGKLLEASFLKEHVRMIEGDASTGSALLDCRFDYIFYTGGTAVGRTVMEKASLHLTLVTLELGGKSPAIVLGDADIRIAARRIAFGKFINCGQTCVAPDYVLIEKDCKDRFMEAFAEETARMYGDAPLDNPEYGKIINRRHFERLCRFISLARNGEPGEGRIAFGGTSDPERLKIAPTLIDGIEGNASIMQEEIFGPILPVMEISGAEDAIKHVNSGERPLAAYVFTSDRRRAREITERIPFGGGCVNDTIMHLASTSLPFGGTGASGMGSYHGEWGFRTFSHYKSILSKGTAIDPPVRYAPYSKRMSRLIHRLIG